MSVRTGMKKNTFAVFVTLLLSTGASADIEIERLGQKTLETLPDHTLIVNTFSDRAVLFNADNAEMLGMLSLGIQARGGIEINREDGLLYVVETYFTRHTRGERTDVVTSYDIKTLSAVSEVIIPPKHSSGNAVQPYNGILGNNQLMLVNNITPAMSVSVIDLQNQTFLGEISTAGCGLVYPIAGLRFLALCGDGTSQMIELDAKGNEKRRARSKVFFSLEDDPLMEKGVKTADGWLFSTFKGKVFRISYENDFVIEEILQLGDEWRIGGIQPLAWHKRSNLLLALMHEGGDNSHKDDGTEVWMYDLSTSRLVHKLILESSAGAIQVSQDASPLIYAGSVGEGKVGVYDLAKGKHLRDLIVSLPSLLHNL